MNEVPYRSAVRPNFSDEPKAPLRDEVDHSTLKMLQLEMDKALKGLSSDFNSFDVLSAKDTKSAAEDLLIDVRARQKAYTILVNLKVALDSAVQRVDSIHSKE